MFPRIRSLADVLPTVELHPEFKVRDMGAYTVVNYTHMTPSLYDGSDILRECRGLIFDSKTGDIINRRFHKFFNVGECDATKLDALKWGETFAIMDKLDGSMVSPCLIQGEWHWLTKNGITSVSMMAAKFADKNPEYLKLAKRYPDSTFIYEFMSRENRVVIDYVTDRMTLLAIRNNVTGEYLPPCIAQDIAWKNGIPFVDFEYVEGKFGQSKLNAHKWAESYIAAARRYESEEGLVIRFANDQFVKVKTDWYLARHGLLDLKTERQIIEAYLCNVLDDMLPIMEPQTKDWAMSIVQKYLDHKIALISKLKEQFVEMDGKSRKEVADVALKTNYSSLWFAVLDGKSANEYLDGLVLKWASKQVQFREKMLALFGWEVL